MLDVIQGNRNSRMAFDFAYLTETENGKKVAVNPHLVRLLYEADGSKVAIIFDNNHQIQVSGTVAEVSDILRKASR